MSKNIYSKPPASKRKSTRYANDWGAALAAKLGPTEVVMMRRWSLAILAFAFFFFLAGVAVWVAQTIQIAKVQQPNNAVLTTKVEAAKSQSVPADLPASKAAQVNEAKNSVASALKAAVPSTAAAALTIPEEADAPSFDRELIISDYKNQMSPAFKIPGSLGTRVGFWFDVYTKHTSDERIIHFQKYPWVVFKVVNISPIIYAQVPAHRWIRNLKAQKYVSNEANRIRQVLKKYARGQSLKSFSDDDRKIIEALNVLKGNLRVLAKEASASIRVQTGQRDYFEEGLSISPRYMPIMEKIFAENRLPTELTRLPFVESSFNHLATSKSGASGIWQFVGQTGKKFLTVSNGIDERRSPIKSTVAAALLLKENYQILQHSWPLAITAYNHGPAGVKRAVRATGSHELGHIIRHYSTRSFNFATINYYSEFLAALYAEKYQREIFGEITSEQGPDTKLTFLSRPIRTLDIIKVTGLSREDLVTLNPELKSAVKRNAFLPKGFSLHLPPDKESLLTAGLARPRHGAKERPLDRQADKQTSTL